MKKLIVLFLLVQNLLAIDAQLDIIRNNIVIPKIIINITDTSNNKKLLKDIKKLLEKDLLVSGHFELITSTYKLKTISSKINYFEKKISSNDLYLALEIKNNNKQGFILHAKLFDLNKQEVVLSKSYTITNKNRYPFLSHKIAININDTLNAPSIKWMDKLIIFSRYTSPKKSEIVVADYTLTYQKIVVKGGLNLFPKWANKQQTSFYYTGYDDVIPSLIKQNLYTSKSEQILSSPGMIVCSDVSFKNGNLLVTMAPSGQPDVYLYDVKNKIKKRITKYSGIDVGGSFVDEDKKIIFISDRLGKANVFSKKINARGVERMVYHGKNNSQASTHNNYIVYSSRESSNEFGYNTFNLYLISTQSDMIRRLTINGQNKFPKFSNDGESILFTKTFKEQSYLGIIRLNYNKSFLFKLKSGKLQSIDW
jgi:TolB protein